MGQFFRIMTSSAWLLLGAVLGVQSASAEPPSYPPADEEWNSTHYAALAQRVESEGLALPTLSGKDTKPVFERMVSVENIPLRVGMNKEVAVTLRYQKLEPALPPLHKLVALYSNEAHKGKPYGTELARLMIYETKAAGTLLSIGDPYLATLVSDKRYQFHVANLDQFKKDARQIYVGLVQSMSETRLYAKSDLLRMVGGALNELPAYHPILTNEDRQTIVQKLTAQISTTSDGELKKAFTDLRDTIQNRRFPT